MSEFVQIYCPHEIKSCPFCGSESHLYEYQEMQGAEWYSYKVICCDNEDCGMSLPPREFFRARREEALDAWNTRAQTKQPMPSSEEIMKLMPSEPWYDVDYVETAEIVKAALKKWGNCASVDD